MKYRLKHNTGKWWATCGLTEYVSRAYHWDTEDEARAEITWNVQNNPEFPTGTWKIEYEGLGNERQKVEVTVEVNKIPNIEQALVSPFDYELSYNWLGWQLQLVGEKVAMAVSDKVAMEVIAAMKKVRDAEKAEAHEVD